MHNEAKRRPSFSFQFFERGDYRHYLLRTCGGLGPISKKTIAKIFVNYPMLILDYLLATENPRAEKNIQILALHVATKRRKTANVGDEKPARNSLDLAQRSLQDVRFVLLGNGQWLPELENLIADCDLVSVS